MYLFFADVAKNGVTKQTLVGLNFSSISYLTALCSIKQSNDADYYRRQISYDVALMDIRYINEKEIAMFWYPLMEIVIFDNKWLESD